MIKKVEVLANVAVIITSVVLWPLNSVGVSGTPTLLLIESAAQDVRSRVK